MQTVLNSYCGHRGKKLSAKNKKDTDSGFCAKCRKSPPDGQMRFDGSIVKKAKKARGK